MASNRSRKNDVGQMALYAPSARNVFDFVMGAGEQQWSGTIKGPACKKRAQGTGMCNRLIELLRLLRRPSRLRILQDGQARMERRLGQARGHLQVRRATLRRIRS